MTDPITANLRLTEKRIQAAAERAGRDPAEIRLLPVSKTRPTADILVAHEAGYRRFGENLVQEAMGKWEALREVVDLEWAVIGHLQSNKAKFVARFATEFQALSSLKVASLLDRHLQRAGRRLRVLVQVNSSGEDSKFGLPPSEVLAFAKELGAFDSLDVGGLMTLAVFSEEQERVAQCFSTMQLLQKKLLDAHGEGWKELSMGMSGDFELAIEHGATCVRVGQAIFGSRLDPNQYWPTAGK